VSPRPRYLELLRALASQGVSFIVVGGVAAVLEGAPITTLDLGVLYDRRTENLERILAVLDALQARYRDPAGREIHPNRERLENLRIPFLLTELGPLDLLTEVGHGWIYDDRLPAPTVRTVGELEVRVLALRKLIEVKEIAGRDKDRAMLPLLRRALELQAAGN
jgi:hypothetical protein